MSQQDYLAAADARKQTVQTRYLGDSRKANSMAQFNGMKTSNFPNCKREGIFSILDRKIARGDAIRSAEALGDGAVSLGFFGEDGVAISGEDATISLNNITFTADSLGRFRMVDEAFLDEKYKQEKEKRDYIDELTKKMVTDEVFAKTVGLPPDVFEKIAKATGGAEIGMPKELLPVDARPSIMESFVPHSQLQLQSLSKMRCIIRKFLPILQKKKETGTGDLSAKDAFMPSNNADTKAGLKSADVAF